MVVKPQDVIVLVKLHSLAGRPWSYANLATQLFISPATVHSGLQIAAAARLYDQVRKVPIRANLLEFLVHGVKYCFPPRRGGLLQVTRGQLQPGKLIRGVPTSYAASPLVSRFPPSNEPIPVWPFPEGQARGLAFEPLYPSVPFASLADPRFAELMALIDAIRDGRARESQAAIEELTKRMKPE